MTMSSADDTDNEFIDNNNNIIKPFNQIETQLTGMNTK